MITQFADYVLHHSPRLAMPIGINAGLEIAGITVQQAVTSAEAQAEAALALYKTFATGALMTGMDLSVEAEAFGCPIRISDKDVPTVIGRLVQSEADLDALPSPQPGDGRTPIYLDAARQLVDSFEANQIPVLGGMIGPFSLAGRLFGVSEILMASMMQPELVEKVVEKVMPFLTAYAAAYRDAGVAGVIMAEPSAGLLSPAGLARFSSPYVRRIVEAVQTPECAVILHNCGAKLVHLPKVLEAGAEIYHFGAPMDIPAALKAVDGKVVLGGNLDPASVFYMGTPDTLRAATQSLLEATRQYPNFFISSGCDLPPGISKANLTAFYETAQQFGA
jgi:uroporphyrinogen decarboxylase